MLLTIETSKEEMAFIEGMLTFFGERQEDEQPLLLKQEKLMCLNFAQKLILSQVLARQGV